MTTRRRILKCSLAAAVPLGVPLLSEAEGSKQKVRVAALLTSFHYRSHAHVILENFLVPYLFNGEVVDPTAEFEMTSFYVDQFTARDMARDVAGRFDISIYDSIAKALCDGGDQLAVDAVLLIGEHGDYPFNDKGQELYPKQRFFDEIVAVFKRSKRSVPVYTDKHLSHTWKEADGMVGTAEAMSFALMAGSSVPLAQRVPPLDIPAGAKVVEAVSIHGGPLERFGFHGLEVLQSMIESRHGGESGIASVQYLEGEALWAAADAGEWSEDLATAAMAVELGDDTPRLRDLVKTADFAETPPHGFLLRYRDGMRAIVLKIGVSGIRWNFSAQLEGRDDPLATRFYVGPWENRNLFKALANAIQSHFRGESPYPVQRTQLVTGALEAAIDSHLADGMVIATPQLTIEYQATDFRKFRELGRTWQIITDETPQPESIEAVKIPKI